MHDGWVGGQQWVQQQQQRQQQRRWVQQQGRDRERKLTACGVCARQAARGPGNSAGRGQPGAAGQHSKRTRNWPRVTSVRHPVYNAPRLFFRGEERRAAVQVHPACHLPQRNLRQQVRAPAGLGGGRPPLQACSVLCVWCRPGGLGTLWLHHYLPPQHHCLPQDPLVSGDGAIHFCGLAEGQGAGAMPPHPPPHTHTST